MGKWKPYNVGQYRLGQLSGEAVAVWYDGKPRARHRFRLGVTTEAEGRAALARFAGRNDKLEAEASHRITDIWTAYIANRERDGKGMHIFRFNWLALKPTFGDLLASDITEAICITYARERFALGRAPATVNTELSRLNQALKWAFDCHMIPRRPKVWIPSPGQGRSRVITEAEFVAILDGCRQPHVRLFVILCLCTAGRHTAILELTWDRVSFERGEIDLRKPRKVDPMSKRHRKGRAVVAMNDLARAALSEAKAGAQSRYVIEQHGKRIGSCLDGFKAAVARAGLDGITPHTIRHSAATWAWSTMQPHQVARFLGHKDTRTTERVYGHQRADQTAGVAEVVNLKIVR